WKTPVHEPSNGRLAVYASIWKEVGAYAHAPSEAAAGQGLAYNQSGHLAMGEHLVGLASQEQPINPAAAVRGRPDQAAALVECGFDDAVGRMAVAHMHRLAAHALRFREVSRVGENMVAGRGHHLLVLLDRIAIV